jgi:hypothetical protein
LLVYNASRMKLIDAIKQKGNPYFIPDCSRDELPEFFKNLGFKVGVEVGVSWGQNIVDYAKAGLQIYGVDPWLSYEDEPYKKIISIEGKYAKTIDHVYQYAKERTAPYPNCTLIRKMSADAARDFPNRSLDFVYIDANHSFGYIAMDLMKWANKVKKGGVIAGHDYYSTESDRRLRAIGPVVDAFAKVYDFTNWYVLGRKNEDREPNEKFDKNFSYMFFKHW